MSNEGTQSFRDLGEIRCPRFAYVAPPLDIANALRSMALVSELRDDRKAACKLWQEARTLYRECEVENGVA